MIITSARDEGDGNRAELHLERQGTVISFSGRVSIGEYMNPIVWLGLGAAALAGISFLTRLRKARTLPNISNAEFLNLYRQTLAGRSRGVGSESKECYCEEQYQPAGS